MRVLGRQLQRLAEMGGVLVAVETGFVGGHFEQHPARRAEIDRPEIIAVDHRRHLIAGIHQRLAHLQLLFTVFDRKGDVVHGPRTQPRARNIRHGFDVDEVGTVAAGNTEAQNAILTVHFLIAHEFQKLGGRTFIAKTQRGALKTMDRLIRTDAIADPLRAVVIPDLDQRKTVAIGTCKMQALVAEGFIGLQAIHPGLGKTVLPVAERSFRNGKQRRAHLTGARTTAGDMRERKVSHDGAGRTDFIAIIEMIDVRRVEIDRLLHPAQAERIGEKTVVLARARRHGRDVVQALDLVEHDKPLLPGGPHGWGLPCSWRKDGVTALSGIEWTTGTDCSRMMNDKTDCSTGPIRQLNDRRRRPGSSSRQRAAMLSGKQSRR